MGTRDVAFYFFCAFIISYFVRLTARVDFLGKVHFDMILAALTALAIAFAPRPRSGGPAPKLDPVAKQLLILLAYIVITIPFVEWPGSVIHNLENYLKSLCFFFFVVAIVDTTRKLRTLIAVYAVTQVWRVFEPLEMHLRSGYWGSITSLGNWETMDRLSGSPYDIINPNGLGFVIIMTLPLVYLILKPETTLRRVLFAGIAAAMAYALVLSASRSGFLGFVFLGLFSIWRSKHRAAYVAGGIVVALVSFSLMTDLQRERYVSIYSHKAKGAATAEARVTGVIGDFKVSLRRPFFGHGLGTSREANGNFRGEDLPSHNLYLEVAEELGYVGLVLVLMLIWSFLKACWTAQRLLAAAQLDEPRLRFLHSVATTLVVVVAVDLFFSFAAFGFSEPYWYFFGGLSVVTARLALKLAPGTQLAVASGRRAGRLLQGGRAPLRARGAAPTPRAASAVAIATRMCGICGFVSSAGWTAATLQSMNDVIFRRGPDGEGSLHSGPVGIAMRRLAIIDVAGGSQPVYNEDHSVAVVFNGEIYNFKALREGLRVRGHTFRTHSDTEVIVHLYEERGADLVRELEGMFTFALWDARRETLLLARDRLGIKPLFIAQLPSGVLFGSEIKSLLATGLVPTDMDWQALDAYLTYTFIPAPRTIYQAIRKVLPGTTLAIGPRGEVTTRRYWEVPDPKPAPASEHEWVTRVEAAFKHAVESHLVSDVPVGAFLSGGVDSGLMVAMMAAATERPVETFTVGFADAGASFIDERVYARMIAQRYRLNHHEISVEPHVADIIDDIVTAFDEPFADDSVIPSYYVSQVAAGFVKVALTGLGGDELFGGYRRHLGVRIGDAYARVPRWLREGVVDRAIRRIPEPKTSSDLVDHLKRFSRSSSALASRRYQDSMSTLPSAERAASVHAGVGGTDRCRGHGRPLHRRVRGLPQRWQPRAGAEDRPALLPAR